MYAVFSRKAETIDLIEERGGIGAAIWRFTAANRTASNSRGPWPAGVYKMDASRGLIKVGGPQGSGEGSFGPYFLPFTVPDRDGLPDESDLDGNGNPADENDGPGVGMGLHSGRLGVRDGHGNAGYLHVTHGCIRTTDAAMERIARLWYTDRLHSLWVLD